MTLAVYRLRQVAIEHGSACTRRSSSLGYTICVAIILSSTLLQKIAIPGTSSVLPISIAIVAGGAALALLKGVLIPDSHRLFFFLVFIASTCISVVVSSSDYVSVPGWFFVVAIQCGFVLRFRPGAVDPARIERFVSDLAFVCAVIGLLQFALQLAVGPKLAFPIESFLPEPVRLKGFVNIIPIRWNSPILKSNGVFFAEPSFFSQFLALGLVTEMIGRARLVRLLLFALAMLSSFSGTGPMVVLVFLVATGRFRLLVAGAAGFWLLTQIPALQLSALTDRSAEFSNTDSSGFARFVSIFYLLQDYVVSDPVALLVGRGPGTVTEFGARVSYGTFGPTWGKILYEYGVIGFAAYLLFFGKSFVATGAKLRLPLAFTYFLLGGYLLSPIVVSQLLVLVSWPVEARPRQG